MKWLCLVLAFSSCSLIYDPKKAPLATCADGSTDSCEVRPNTAASCDASGACAYQCVDGFYDVDGMTSTGCEASCAPGAPPAPDVEAIAGETDRAIRWHWPKPVDAPGDVRLCTGSLQGDFSTCVEVTGSTACDDTGCNTTTEGPDNVRVYARFQARDGCGKITPEATAATVSATPLNGTFLTLDGLSLESSCNGAYSVAGGELTLNNPLNFYCITAVTLGDDIWQDVTLRTEMNIADIANGDPLVGVALRYPQGLMTPRITAVLTPTKVGLENSVAVYRRAPNSMTDDQAVATSTFNVSASRWLQLQVVARGPVISVSVGDVGSTLTEVVRWNNTSTVAGGERGRLGLFLLNIGVAEHTAFRRFTASTRTVLPPPGPTSLIEHFDGASLPGSFRVVPSQSPMVKQSPCPSYPAAIECDGGCQPNPGSGCLEINQTMNNISATVDAPVGIDTTRPWHLRFKFAAEGNGNNPRIVRDIFGSLLRGNGLTWNNNLLAFRESTGTLELAPSTWNLVEVLSTGANVSIKLNGADAFPLGPYPVGYDAHLGAFSFGGDDGRIHGYWTDVEIAQP